jgi:hypothetical protein
MLALIATAVYDTVWWDYGRLSDRDPGATPILSMALIIGGRHARRPGLVHLLQEVP